MIFVDTGAFLARYVARDRYHAPAVAAWGRIRDERVALVTSSLVLCEMCTLLGRVAGNEFAARRAEAAYRSPALTILRPEEADEAAALVLFEKYAKHDVSFTDCTSFVLMRRERLQRAFSADRGFVRAGFLLWPD